MILVADAHVSTEPGADSRFLRFLAAVAATTHDVVFLGDIFDLWIGFPRYEVAAHQHFLDWCAAERSRRSIGYVDGNREYFVTANHGDKFTVSDPDRLSLPNGILAVHGDAINRNERANLWFRWIGKGPLGYWVLRLLPGGPQAVLALKRYLNGRRAGMDSVIPEARLQAFAGECFDHGARRVFVGHYHDSFLYETEEGRGLYVIPAWCEGEQIGLFDEVADKACFGTWNDLL
jgi:UDP-2,3-diacylglucosamine pyrophosphatase LpxH